MPPTGPVEIIDGVFEARVVARRGRFTVLVEDARGTRMECWLPDPAGAPHLLRPGAAVAARREWRPGRRTPCTVKAFILDEGGSAALAELAAANRLFARTAEAVMPGLEGLTPEPAAPGARADFAATGPGGEPVLIEVKATNLVEDGVALFPAAASRRASRQLDALAAAARAGARSILVIAVLAPGASLVRPNRRVDPVFSRRLCAYTRTGLLEALALSFPARLVDGRVEVYYGGLVGLEPCPGGLGAGAVEPR